MSDLHSSPPAKRHALRIPKSRRRAIYTAFAILLITGVAWLAIRLTAEDPAELAALLAWSMKIHGAAAWVATYLVGTIWTAHIKLAWKLGHNCGAGAAVALMLAMLLVTGYGLYYFNGELLRMLTEWLHWITSALAVTFFWLHINLGKRYRKSSLR